MVVILFNLHSAFAFLKLNGLMDFVWKVTVGAGPINLPAIIFQSVFIHPFCRSFLGVNLETLQQLLRWNLDPFLVDHS